MSGPEAAGVVWLVLAGLALAFVLGYCAGLWRGYRHGLDEAARLERHARTVAAWTRERAP